MSFLLEWSECVLVENFEVRHWHVGVLNGENWGTKQSSYNQIKHHGVVPVSRCAEYKEGDEKHLKYPQEHLKQALSANEAEITEEVLPIAEHKRSIDERKESVSNKVDEEELEEDCEFEVDFPHKLVSMELFLCIFHLNSEEVCICSS